MAFFKLNACESNSLIMFSVFKNRGDKSLLNYMLASIRTPIIVKCEIDLFKFNIFSIKLIYFLEMLIPCFIARIC
jgi:hypothetical protein